MKISTRFIIAAITAVILTPAYAELPEVIPPTSSTEQVMPPAAGTPVAVSSAPVTVSSAPVTASSAAVTIGAPIPPSTTAPHTHHKRNGIRVSLNIDDESFPSVSFTQNGHHNKHHGPYWIAMHAGEPIPTNAVIGGNGSHTGGTFYVCRAQYHGGVHPGKLVHGNCNIAWGRHEVVLHHYEVLVS